jgi:hypothetical protein
VALSLRQARRCSHVEFFSEGVAPLWPHVFAALRRDDCLHSDAVGRLSFVLANDQRAIRHRCSDEIDLGAARIGVHGWLPMHQRAVLAAGGATVTDTMHVA